MKNISAAEVRQLRYFITVAEERNFRRAAHRLGVAQPNLTQSIRKLEAGIGAELFDRTQRPVRLTAAGQALAAEAPAVLAQLDTCIRRVRKVALGDAGLLRVTHVGSAALAFLPAVIRAYRQLRPDVEIDVRERTTAAQLVLLQNGAADVALVRPPAVGGDDLCCETVLRERLVVALPEAHRLRRRRRIGLPDLRRDGFIMFPAREGPSFHARIVLACEQAGFTMRIVQEAVQMHAIVSLVAAGLGIALVPASMRSLRQPGVVYRDLIDPGPLLSVELAAVWRKDQQSPLLQGFLETMRGHGPTS